MKNYLSICLALLAGSLLLAQGQETPFYAGDQSVFILPTANTMPQAKVAITSCELLVWQCSISATDRLHFSAGTVLPIEQGLFNTFSFGAKYRYLSYGKLKSAAWLSFSPYSAMITLGNVFSLSGEKAGLHLAGTVFSQARDGDTRFGVGMGGTAKLVGFVNIMGEAFIVPDMIWTEQDVFEDPTSYASMYILGLRLKLKRGSLDLGGIREFDMPKEDTMYALPFIKLTMVF